MLAATAIILFSLLNASHAAWFEIQLIEAANINGGIGNTINKNTGNATIRNANHRPRLGIGAWSDDDIDLGDTESDFEIKSVQTLKGTPAHNKPLLWVFVANLLLDPQYNDILHFIDSQCTFYINKPEDLAQLWGLEGHRSNMNYEKMSRAMRQYKDHQQPKIVHLSRDRADDFKYRLHPDIMKALQTTCQQYWNEMQMHKQQRIQFEVSVPPRRN